jgi:hypothetical protein
MSPLVVADNGGKKFTPHEAGTFLGVCVDLIDHGLVKTEWQGKPRERHLIQFAFETNADYREIETKEGAKLLVPQMIWSRKFTASLAEKSALRPWLEGWRGRPFSAEELKGFDVETVVGVNAMIGIIHKEHKGDIFANIGSIVKPMRGVQWIEPAKRPDGSPVYVRRKDRPQPQDGGDSGAPELEPGYLDSLEDDDLPF